ncbi:hypothetical protein DFH11DRAFT_1605851 [Phellopilus nigrolimitatus]|nr:hypothetical protein DFH11DRAFT_1605851 [Phellopilus nigrolimitatus]
MSSPRWASLICPISRTICVDFYWLVRRSAASMLGTIGPLRACIFRIKYRTYERKVKKNIRGRISRLKNYYTYIVYSNQRAK